MSPIACCQFSVARRILASRLVYWRQVRQIVQFPRIVCRCHKAPRSALATVNQFFWPPDNFPSAFKLPPVLHRRHGVHVVQSLRVGFLRFVIADVLPPSVAGTPLQFDHLVHAVTMKEKVGRFFACRVTEQDSPVHVGGNLDARDDNMVGGKSNTLTKSSRMDSPSILPGQRMIMGISVPVS